MSPSTLTTDGGGRKTEDDLGGRLLPQTGTHNLPFSYPMSRPSFDHDNERGAWAEAELISYVTGNGLWWGNGLLNMGGPLELCYSGKSETHSSLIITKTDRIGRFINYQNGGGNNP